MAAERPRCTWGVIMSQKESDGVAGLGRWCKVALASVLEYARIRVPRWEGTADAARMTSRQVGDLGEKVAGRYLTKRGYRILETNWWAPGRRGELDMVAFRRGTLVAVEVRSYSAGEATAADVLNSDKRRRLVRLIKQYAKLKRRLGCNLRVDLVVVEWERIGKVSSIRHFEGAATEHEG